MMTETIVDGVYSMSEVSPVRLVAQFALEGDDGYEVWYDDERLWLVIREGDTEVVAKFDKMHHATTFCLGRLGWTK